MDSWPQACPDPSPGQGAPPAVPNSWSLLTSLTPAWDPQRGFGVRPHPWGAFHPLFVLSREISPSIPALQGNFILFLLSRENPRLLPLSQPRGKTRTLFFFLPCLFSKGNWRPTAAAGAWRGFVTPGARRERFPPTRGWQPLLIFTHSQIIFIFQPKLLPQILEATSN